MSIRRNPPTQRQIFVRAVIWKWSTNYGIARKLWDVRLSQLRKGVFGSRFFWENNALNTPAPR